LIEGFGIVYFIAAAVVFLICIFPLLAIKRRVKKGVLYRLLISLLLSITFAPSIFGYDLGVVTLPALCIIVLSLLGKLRFIALVWSVFSITVVTFLFFGIWSLVSFYRGMPNKKDNV